MDKFFYNLKITIFTIVLVFIAGQSIAAPLEDLVEKNPRKALLQIKEALGRNANDENALFLQARAHENLGQTEVAKRQYELFLERFPARPEAYLNLANIHSSKGDFKRARQLLEQGLLSKSEYAQLYQSLKKLNGHLAVAAYQRALSKDNAPASPALATASRLTPKEVQIREVEVIKEVPVEIIKEVEVVKEVIKEVPVPVDALATNNRAVANQTKQQSFNTRVPTVLDQKQAIDNKPEQNLIPIVKSWAAAWSDQSVGRFVSFYAPDYSAKGKTRNQWLQDRKLKLTNKSFITVSVDGFKQSVKNDIVSVTFKQNYQSNVVSGISTKRLTFKKIGENWKIVAERIIR